jgi:hypothetical protein
VPNVSGDALILLGSCDQGGANNWTTAGYTEVWDSSSNGLSSFLSWKISAGTNEAFAVPTSVRSDSLACVGIVIKDVPASAITNGSASATYVASELNTQFPALTTTEDDCLILYISFFDEIAASPVVGAIGLNGSWDGSVAGVMVSFGYQKTAGAVYRPYAWVAGGTGAGGQLWTVAIKSSAAPVASQSGKGAGSCLAAMTGGKVTWANPTATVTALTNGAYTTAETFNFTTPTSSPQGIGYLASRILGGGYIQTGGVTRVDCAVYPLSSTDLSAAGTLLAWSYKNDEVSQITDQIPFSIGLRSDGAGTPGYRFWLGGGVDSTPPSLGTNAPLVFEVNNTSFDMDNIGTINTAAIDGVFVMAHRGNVGGNSVASYWGACFVLSDLVCSAGSETNPCNFGTFHSIARGSGMLTTFNNDGLSSSQLFSLHPLKIGAGDGDLYWNSLGQSVQFGLSSDVTVRRLAFHGGEGALGLKVLGISGETINLSKTAVDFRTKGYITYDALCSDACVWTHDAAIFKNATVTLRDIGVGAYSGLLILGCDEVVHNDANVSGITFEASLGTQAITLTGDSEAALQALVGGVEGCSFVDNSVAIRIEYTGTSPADITLTFSDVLWSGNTTDIHFYAAEDATLTAVMSGSSNATISAISGFAISVTIADYVTYTLSGLVAGSEVRIVETGTVDELAGIESSGTSFTYQYVYVTDVDVDVIIHHVSYIPIRLVGVTLTDASSTQTVQQTVDGNYGNPA